MKNPSTRPAPGGSPTRTRPQQGASIARREAAAARKPATAVTRPQAQPAVVASTFPISAPRVLACIALLLLLILSLAGPRSITVPDTSPLVTPNIDGSNSLTSAVSAGGVTDDLFRYRSVIERSQGNQPLVPDNVRDVFHYPMDSIRVRQVIVGQMIASTSGNLDQALVDTGFFSGINEQKLQDIEGQYRGMLSDDQNGDKGINGLAVIAFVRSLSASGAERAALEQAGISGLQNAVESSSDTWQFGYNWALANFLLGNYAQAYDAMRSISSSAENDNNRMPALWMGISALHMGDPGEAMTRFQALKNLNIQGGNDVFQNQLAQLRDIASEGYADAQWANRDPAGAYNSYLSTLTTTSSDDTGLYDKWLTLGLEQRAYDRLAADLAGLETSGSSLGNSARVHHDRARLLTYLGRTSEADSEYRQALSLGENDPSLHVSYGQFLESQGNHNGALSEVDQALRGLGKDPATSDLTGIAHAVSLTTTTYTDLYNDQQILDANLLRAEVWGSSGQTSNLNNLVNNISLGADKAPAKEGGLINLYAGFAAEAGGAYDKAVTSFSAAWDKLKGTPAGTPGRAAALAGLARATAKTKDASAGVQVLASNGYDPAAPKQAMSTDPDAPDLLYQGSLLLGQAGKATESANAARVSAILRNSDQAYLLDGVGRPLWYPSGTVAPVEAVLAAANQARTTPGANPSEVAALYQRVYSLDPAMAPALNNLGVLYAQQGNTDLANFYLNAAGKVSPGYALGQHNQAALEYNRGIGNFFNAEAAQAGAIKAAGPSTLNRGYSLQADNQGAFPAPYTPSNNLLDRLPAILIVLLLLIQTVVGNDRVTNRVGLLPGRGAFGWLGSQVDEYAKRYFPNLVKPSTGTNALLITILIPTVIGMFGLALAAAHWSLGVAVVFLPVALLSALIAFGSNEVVQRWMASRYGTETAHHPWPLGVLLGIVSIPFAFVYGWQAVTRLRPSSASDSTARFRTEEEQDINYEARMEALAEMTPEQARAQAGAPVAVAAPSSRLFNLGPAARIMFAGLLANLALVIIFGVAYWALAWPSLRLAMYASALVLAFTAVSEPPADGWTLYRRNAPLWLAVFTIAATVATLLAAGLM